MIFAESRNPVPLYIALILANLVGIILALGAGRFPVPPGQVAGILLSVLTKKSGDWVPLVESVVLNIRLPRVLMATAGGIGLGLSGAVFQGIFRNPLVSPGVVGVTSGAGFGAAFAILVFGWGFMPQLFAFIFGLTALGGTWLIAKKSGSRSLLIFVLAGVIVNMLCQALISLIKFMADSDDKLPSIVYWLMGSLSATSWSKIAISIPLVLIASIVLILMRRRINLLSLGEEEVRSLGINPSMLMNLVLVLNSVIVAAIVSIAGIVGWVGLLVPHIARMIIGADHERLLPVSALLGGLFFLVVDTLGRSISPQDIPLGILTALVGAPVFIGLLIGSKGEWNL